MQEPMLMLLDLKVVNLAELERRHLLSEELMHATLALQDSMLMLLDLALVNLAKLVNIEKLVHQQMHVFHVQKVLPTVKQVGLLSVILAVKEPMLIPPDLAVVKLVPLEGFKAQRDKHLAINVNLDHILVMVLGNVLPVKLENSRT